MTPAQLRHALGGTPAYTTVMTVLTRLVDKGAATRERAGRGFGRGRTGRQVRAADRGQRVGADASSAWATATDSGFGVGQFR